MNFGGADLRVGTIGLKLAVPQFALGFDEGALFEGAGPFSELPPNDDPMPLGSGLVFTGVLGPSNSRWLRGKTECGLSRWV